MTLSTISMHAFYEYEDIEADGYLSRPSEPGPWPSIVVLHEWWGLDKHFRELSRRLASEGFVVLVPDLYDGEVTEDPQEAARLKTSLEIPRAIDKTVGAVSYLRTLPFVSDTNSSGLLGFCMGGGLALLAAKHESIEALVAYFPSIYPDAAELEEIHCPTLLHYGEEDIITPQFEIDRITTHLEKSGTPYDLFKYEGAGHAFMNDMHEEYYHEEATETAWPRTIEFFKDQLNQS